MNTGNITSITPTVEGGYNSQNGWIHTFDIVIQCPNGSFAGEIGSKSTPYPLGVGGRISFDVNNTQNGVKIKKVNPGYDNKPQGQRPAQGAQGGGNKDRMIVAQVVFKTIVGAGKAITEADLNTGVDMIMRVGTGQPAPTTQGGLNPAQQQEHDAAATVHTGHPVDDIPF